MHTITLKTLDGREAKTEVADDAVIKDVKSAADLAFQGTFKLLAKASTCSSKQHAAMLPGFASALWAASLIQGRFAGKRGSK